MVDKNGRGTPVSRWGRCRPREPCYTQPIYSDQGQVFTGGGDVLLLLPATRPPFSFFKKKKLFFDVSATYLIGAFFSPEKKIKINLCK